MAFKLRMAAVPVEVTRRYTMDEVCDEDHPSDPLVLIVRPALESNPGWANARFKALASAKAAPMSVTVMQETRARNIDIFSKHVVTSWENVYEDGKPLPCTPEAVARLLTQIIESPPGRPDLAGRPDLFDGLFAFCVDPDNFREPMIGAADLGKR